MRTPNILTIAGSDSGGGAGIQADLKTIMALDGYGMSVITALTAQNGLGVTGIHAPEPEFVVLQLRAVLDGFPVHAAKTGMLFSAGIINALADALRDRSFPLVVDPVSVSQSGSRLLREDAVEALKERMIPGCDLLTPNRPEAEMLTGMTISCSDDAAAAGEALIRMGAKAVLIKGGHMESSIVVTDCLCQAGQAPKFLPQPKVETNNNHGTGCTLSAAIATGLGHGLPLQVAVTRAQEFLNLALRKSYAPGKGCGPVNHAARRQASLQNCPGERAAGKGPPVHDARRALSPAPVPLRMRPAPQQRAPVRARQAMAFHLGRGWENALPRHQAQELRMPVPSLREKASGQAPDRHQAGLRPRRPSFLPHQPQSLHAGHFFHHASQAVAVL